VSWRYSISLGWKCLPVTNTLAYFTGASLTNKERFFYYDYRYRFQFRRRETKRVPASSQSGVVAGWRRRRDVTLQRHVTLRAVSGRPDRKRKARPTEETRAESPPSAHLRFHPEFVVQPVLQPARGQLGQRVFRHLQDQQHQRLCSHLVPML